MDCVDVSLAACFTNSSFESEELSHKVFVNLKQLLLENSALGDSVLKFIRNRRSMASCLQKELFAAIKADVNNQGYYIPSKNFNSLTDFLDSSCQKTTPERWNRVLSTNDYKGNSTRVLKNIVETILNDIVSKTVVFKCKAFHIDEKSQMTAT